MTEQLEKILNDLPYSIRHSGEIEELKEFAREQVKRVEELEKDRDALEIKIDKAYRDTHNYKQALEFYADERMYEVTETLPPTDEYQQPIEPVFKDVPIIYYDKGKEARKALEGEG